MILKHEHQSVLIDIDWYYNQAHHDFGIKSDWNDSLQMTGKFEWHPSTHTPALHKIRKFRNINNTLKLCSSRTDEVLYAAITTLDIDVKLLSKINATLISLMFLIDPPIVIPKKFTSLLDYIASDGLTTSMLISIKSRTTALLNNAIKEYSIKYKEATKNEKSFLPR